MHNYINCHCPFIYSIKQHSHTNSQLSNIRHQTGLQSNFEIFKAVITTCTILKCPRQQNRETILFNRLHNSLFMIQNQICSYQPTLTGFQTHLPRPVSTGTSCSYKNLGNVSAPLNIPTTYKYLMTGLQNYNTSIQLTLSVPTKRCFPSILPKSWLDKSEFVFKCWNLKACSFS